jgi:hypothetical protein
MANLTPEQARRFEALRRLSHALEGEVLALPPDAEVPAHLEERISLVDRETRAFLETVRPTPPPDYNRMATAIEQKLTGLLSPLGFTEQSPRPAVFDDPRCRSRRDRVRLVEDLLAANGITAEDVPAEHADELLRWIGDETEDDQPDIPEVAPIPEDTTDYQVEDPTPSDLGGDGAPLE